MKSMEELYKEIIPSDELKKEFLDAAKSDESVKEFLKKHDCPVSVEDVEKFLKEQLAADKDLSEDELLAVSGGSKQFAEDFFLSASIVGCAVAYTVEENS